MVRQRPERVRKHIPYLQNLDFIRYIKAKGGRSGFEKSGIFLVSGHGFPGSETNFQTIFGVDGGHLREDEAGGNGSRDELPADRTGTSGAGADIRPTSRAGREGIGRLFWGDGR
ncbi:MAG: hypothetical protein ACLFOY_05890 [Desulfatibacillaceae bacterium]